MITRWLLRVLVVAALIGLIVAILLARFTNPELTETQLFIHYWQLYVSAIGMGIACIKTWERTE